MPLLTRAFALFDLYFVCSRRELTARSVPKFSKSFNFALNSIADCGLRIAANPESATRNPQSQIRNQIVSKINFEQIESGVNGYLDAALADEKVDRQSYEMAKKNTTTFLHQWLTDENFLRVSPNVRKGILAAADAGSWEELVNTLDRKSVV